MGHRWSAILWDCFWSAWHLYGLEQISFWDDISRKWTDQTMVGLTSRPRIWRYLTRCAMFLLLELSDLGKFLEPHLRADRRLVGKHLQGFANRTCMAICWRVYSIRNC